MTRQVQDAFERQVHDAYEHVRLDDAAQERMLARLMAAQAERGVAEEPADATEASEAVTAPKRRWRLWAGLPLAAAVLVALVVVRFSGVSQQALQESSKEVSSIETVELSDKEAPLSSAEGSAADSATADGAVPQAVEEEVLAGGYDEAVDNAADIYESDAPPSRALTSVDLYPRITRADGSKLTALIDGMDTQLVDASEVGESLGAASASPFDADEAVGCELFALNGRTDAYAVRYEGEEEYWLCVPYPS